jgi:aminoglycoside phosphotransferase (APT) family kinase protein
MHDDTLHVDAAELKSALDAADPTLIAHGMVEVLHHGTDTKLYRLGPDRLLRVPRQHAASAGLASETRVLPLLAPHLPLAVPRIVAHGVLPGTPPVPWCVQTWIEGVDAATHPVEDFDDLAARLATCLLALRAIPVPPTAPSSPRGGPLLPQDDAFRAALETARAQKIDGLDPATTIWDRGLAAAPWTADPVWLHADLVPGNLILSGGRLAALIDWSFATVGDPAYDLIPAWFLLDRASRTRFLSALAPDAATIARARARVAWQCALALPHYLHTNPAMVRLARAGLARLTDGGP